MNQQPQQQQIRANLKDATKCSCSCGCKDFAIRMNVYTISALMSPTGQEIPVEVPRLVCTKCGEQFIHGMDKEDKDAKAIK